MSTVASRKDARKARKQRDDDSQAEGSQQTQAPATASQETPEARPAYYFFYGTLTDAEFMQGIAGLAEKPIMVKAKVRNVQLKYYWYFKALVPGDDAVEGAACYVPDIEAVDRLRAFETDAYVDSWTDIEVENGRKIRGRLFMSALAPNKLRDSPD